MFFMQPIPGSISEAAGVMTNTRSRLLVCRGTQFVPGYDLQKTYLGHVSTPEHDPYNIYICVSC